MMQKFHKFNFNMKNNVGSKVLAGDFTLIDFSILLLGDKKLRNYEIVEISSLHCMQPTGKE